MNGDLSLSQSLGGLRIANPDEDNSAPSPPPPHSQGPDAEDDDAAAAAHRPPSSSPTQFEASSVSPAMSIAAADDFAKQRPPPPSSQHPPPNSQHPPPNAHAQLLPEPTPAPAALGFNPSDYAAFSANGGPPPSQQAPFAHASAQAHAQYASSPPQYASSPPLAHRQSMPLARHAQQQAALAAPYGPGGPSQPRGPPPHALRDRPMSSIYNHPNLSSSSTNATSIPGTYRYSDDGMAGDMRRAASSRVAPDGMHNSMPTREASLSERYRQPAHMLPGNGGNGPAPPRRSSRRMPVDGPHTSSAPAASHLSTSPYAIEGGPLASSEDWKDKGAAVGTRQEVDQNGRPVTRVVKKGVKDFNFGRTLGEGSYSTVMAATDRQTLREYAIKVLDKRHIIKEKKVKYVNIEKDTLNRLTEHPGIVRLYYTFQDERSLYFVLDLASGGELLGFLKKMVTFDVECTRFYGAQILDAIEYMHYKGVIHRDLKPENVLLDEQMHVKITDFGTAKILDQKKVADGSGSITGDPLEGADTDRAQSFVGTAEYVSPELLTDKNACKASDLWAFGCIIYQLLAGRPPFKAANEYQTFQKIVGLEYTFPDGFPPVAKDLVERLLVLDPVKRLPVEHIKTHQFFDGITWGKGLWKQKAPRLKSYIPPPHEPVRLNLNGNYGPYPPKDVLVGNTAPGGSANPGASSTTQLRPTPRLITELPPPSQLDIEWSPVLTKRDERILKLGNMCVTHHPPGHPVGKKGDDAASEAPKKFSRFFGGNTAKKRQRLVMITSNARVLMCATNTNEKKCKEEISLLSPGCTWRCFQDSKGLTAWFIETRDKQFVFEDPKSTTSDPNGSKFSTQEWFESIDQARDFAQSTANSYSNDVALNDLSSPSSTIGGDSALDGVNIPTARHLRKDHGETESVKGRKRFSKRHSKNGLANF